MLLRSLPLLIRSCSSCSSYATIYSCTPPYHYHTPPLPAQKMSPLTDDKAAEYIAAAEARLPQIGLSYVKLDKPKGKPFMARNLSSFHSIFRFRFHSHSSFSPRSLNTPLPPAPPPPPLRLQLDSVSLSLSSHNNQTCPVTDTTGRMGRRFDELPPPLERYSPRRTE